LKPASQSQGDGLERRLTAGCTLVFAIALGARNFRQSLARACRVAALPIAMSARNERLVPLIERIEGALVRALTLHPLFQEDRHRTDLAGYLATLVAKYDSLVPEDEVGQSLLQAIYSDTWWRLRRCLRRFCAYLSRESPSNWAFSSYLNTAHTEEIDRCIRLLYDRDVGVATPSEAILLVDDRRRSLYKVKNAERRSIVTNDD